MAYNCVLVSSKETGEEFLLLNDGTAHLLSRELFQQFNDSYDSIVHPLPHFLWTEVPESDDILKRARDWGEVVALYSGTEKSIFNAHKYRCLKHKYYIRGRNQKHEN